MRFVLILMMAVLADSKMTYDTIKKTLRDYADRSQIKAQKPIASKRSGPVLCASCPEVALAPNATCETRWAPQYGPQEGEACVCLQTYTCCPSTCPIVKGNACADKATDTSTPATDTSTSANGSHYTNVTLQPTVYKTIQYNTIQYNTTNRTIQPYYTTSGTHTSTSVEPSPEPSVEPSDISRAGTFFTQEGIDCCECRTASCVRCPPPVLPGALACGDCYHYKKHHTHNNQTMCWESGCQRNAPIIYPDPGCDKRCQTGMLVKDDCDNNKLICIDKPTPLGCMPAKPDEKQCFYAPKKVFQEKFYFSNETCQRCWVWEVKRKLEGCSQTFPLSESCPAGHKKTSGVTTCDTPRDICMPCTTTKAVCTECETLVTVQDACGSPVKTCVKKRCPPVSQRTEKTWCGNVEFRKDDCGCETAVCDANIRLAGAGSTSSAGRVEVFHDGRWGTVCNDYFDNNDAKVVCRMLGFTSGKVSSKNNNCNVDCESKYGAGTGQIWLDDVKCAGNELSIFQCSHKASGENNCSHPEDVGVDCS